MAKIGPARGGLSKGGVSTGPASSGASGYTSSGGGGSTPYITTNGSIEVSPITDKMFYNTVSCPCSTYLITDSANKFGCEREYYGVKQYFKPSLRTNHFIENTTPSIGDKWACEDKTCTQSGYAFDGFYVVDVKENKSGPSSALVNSRKFTENCFIPKALYFNDYTTSINQETLDFLASKQLTTVGGIPVFTNEVGVKAYISTVGASKGGSDSFVNYDFGGIKGWAPADIRLNNKAITKCFINNVNILKKHLSPQPNNLAQWENTSNSANMVVGANGGLVSIRINGINKPTFSLTIKDSTGCNILSKQLKHVQLESSGEFILEQRIPAIGGKALETYNITITPAADTDVFFSGELIKGAPIMKKVVYQFKSPSISIVSNTCTTCGTHTNTGTTAVSLRDEAFSTKESVLKHTSVIASSSGKLYISKDLNFDNCVVRDDIIKKVLVNKGRGILHGGPLDRIEDITFEDADTSLGTEVGGFTRPYSGDIKVGMVFESSIEVVKTIFKTIALDVIKSDDCVDCDDTRLVKTNKLNLGTTLNLFPGMRLVYRGYESTIDTVDCGVSITLVDEGLFYVGDELTFTHSDGGEVLEVFSNTRIKTTGVALANRAKLIFSNRNRAQISGDVAVNKQGAGEITITTTIHDFQFGSVDTGFSLDLDSFLSLKPTARDIYVDAPKNSTLFAIDIIQNVGVNAADLTFTITKEPNSGRSAAYEGRLGGALTATRAYAPNPNFTGLDTMKYTISDGTTTSDEKTIFITVK